MTGSCTSHIWPYQEPGSEGLIKVPTIGHWLASKNSSEPLRPSHILMTRFMISPFLDALPTMWPQERQSWGHGMIGILITLKIPDGSVLTSVTLWERKSSSYLPPVLSEVEGRTCHHENKNANCFSLSSIVPGKEWELWQAALSQDNTPDQNT